MKRKIKIFLFIAAPAVIALGGYLIFFRPSPRPNILLVSIDSLRADHLGCYGYARDTSPVIDRLAGAGTAFKNAVSPTSWTLPAHMSLFTSMDIMVHGVGGDGVSLHPDLGTLAGVLQANGYRTAGFVSSPYMNPAFGFDRGFDLYRNIDLDDSEFEDTVLPPEEQRDAVHSDITSPRITELALDWLEKNSSENFFIFLHMWDVHYDYIPPPPYDTKFDPDYDGDIDSQDFIHNPKINPEMDPRDLEHIIALYDGEIAYVDHHIGLIVQKLKELGIFDDTLIVITADHGDEFYEHGGKGHRNTLFDEVIMVPLVLRLPSKIPAGKMIDEQVALIDIAPTILRICGIAPPEWMEGISLLSGMKDAEAAGRPVLLELDLGLKGTRTNSYKLLFNTHLLQTIIFDLVEGPDETYSHLITDPVDWNEINRLFYDRLTEDRRLAEEYRGGSAGKKVSLSPEERAKLKALGYLK